VCVALLEPQGLREALTAAVQSNIKHLYYMSRTENSPISADSAIVLSEIESKFKQQDESSEYTLPSPPDVTAKVCCWLC
jgi:hypothetical protein